MSQQFKDDSVKEIIASGRPVVIDFWATWCGPCKRMAPLVDELAEEYAGKAEIGKYNIDEETDLATEFRIMSIPTVLFFKNGEMVPALRLVGGQQKDTLRANIEKLIEM